MSSSSSSSQDAILLRSPRNTRQQYPPSPPLSSRSFNDSNDSLRALELSDGPIDASRLGLGATATSSSSSATTRVARSYSFSGFDFQQDLLPLSTSLSEPERAGGVGGVGEKSIGLVNAIALIAGLQIGSGIFSSPGVVIANTQSVGASLLVWLASGLLAWTGASSFAELGSAIPLNGGAQAYLAYAYNPLVSYLFAWTAISALKPGSNGVIALIFAEYVNRLFWHARLGEDVTLGVDAIPQWSIKLTACGAVLFVTLICVVGKNMGTRAQVGLTAIKVGSLLLIAIIGIVQLARGRSSLSMHEDLFEGTSKSPSAYALALYSGLWAFDGFDQANYVGGEMRNAEKNIPRAIHSSMLVVIILFMLTNISYFVVLDKTVVGMSNTVALDFGRRVFGAVGGSLFAALVAISCFGALNGSTFTSARLIYVAAKEGYLPQLFGRIHKTRGTPLNAMLLQGGLTMFFIVFGGGFRSLINFAVVASWAFYFLTVLGLVILRVKEPELPRPYKTWIITPLTFCAVALFLLCMPVIAAPLEALAVLAFVLAGVPLYYLTRRPDSEETSRLSRFGSRFTNLFARLRGGGGAMTRGGGWTRVATEADGPEAGDTVEMSGRGRVTR